MDFFVGDEDVALQLALLLDEGLLLELDLRHVVLLDLLRRVLDLTLDFLVDLPLSLELSGSPQRAYVCFLLLRVRLRLHQVAQQVPEHVLVPLLHDLWLLALGWRLHREVVALVASTVFFSRRLSRRSSLALQRRLAQAPNSTYRAMESL